MEAQVVRIQMVRERAVQYESPMSSSLECYQILKEIFDGADREMFVVVCLDPKHRITAINVASVGTLTESLVHPREAFKPAILSNSASIILAHNHPSGDPTPSWEDEEIARQIIEAGKILKIAVLDFLIVGDARYLSMADNSWNWGHMTESFAPANHKGPSKLEGGEKEVLKALRAAGPASTREVLDLLRAAVRGGKKQARGRK